MPSSHASACAATAAPTSMPALDLGKGRWHSEGDEERRVRETKRDLYLHWQCRKGVPSEGDEGRGREVPCVEADTCPMSLAPPVDVASGEEWRGGDDGVERGLPWPRPSRRR